MVVFAWYQYDVSEMQKLHEELMHLLVSIQSLFVKYEHVLAESVISTYDTASEPESGIKAAVSKIAESLETSNTPAIYGLPVLHQYSDDFAVVLWRVGRYLLMINDGEYGVDIKEGIVHEICLRLPTPKSVEESMEREMQIRGKDQEETANGMYEFAQTLFGVTQGSYAGVLEALTCIPSNRDKEKYREDLQSVFVNGFSPEGVFLPMLQALQQEEDEYDILGWARLEKFSINRVPDTFHACGVIEKFFDDKKKALNHLMTTAFMFELSFEDERGQTLESRRAKEIDRREMFSEIQKMKNLAAEYRIREEHQHPLASSADVRAAVSISQRQGVWRTRLR
jgi:hypothetical protein